MCPVFLWFFSNEGFVSAGGRAVRAYCWGRICSGQKTWRKPERRVLLENGVNNLRSITSLLLHLWLVVD